MQKRLVYISLGCAAVIVAAGIGYFAMRSPSEHSDSATTAPSETATASRELPNPSVVVINRGAVLVSSRVGQDVNRQIQAFADSAKAELDKQGQALQSDAKQMQPKLATLAPDARQKWISSYEARQAALQDMAQRKDSQLKATLAKSRGVIEQALGPILQDVTKEHGANLVLDSQAIIFGDGAALDITREVIEKLDAKLPSYKVVLVSENSAP